MKMSYNFIIKNVLCIILFYFISVKKNSFQVVLLLLLYIFYGYGFT